jgi:hypothetical protein
MEIAFSKIGIYRVLDFGKMFSWQGLASPFLTKLRSLNEKLVNLRFKPFLFSFRIGSELPSHSNKKARLAGRAFHS